MDTTKIARGTWQLELWRTLLAGQTLHNPVASLRGRATSYAGRYNDSFHSMLQRAADAGYTIKYTPGPRGGQWGATYTLER